MIARDLTVLKEEALPSVSSVAQVFANAPAGTECILLTVRTAALTVRFDGGDPTAGANGHEFAVSTGAGPYELALDGEKAHLVRAIASSGTPTGWITYLGRVRGD